MANERPTACKDCAQWVYCEGSGRLPNEVKITGAVSREEIAKIFERPCVTRILNGHLGWIERPKPPPPPRKPEPVITIAHIKYEPDADGEARLWAMFPKEIITIYTPTRVLERPAQPPTPTFDSGALVG